MREATKRSGWFLTGGRGCLAVLVALLLIGVSPAHALADAPRAEAARDAPREAVAIQPPAGIIRASAGREAANLGRALASKDRRSRPNRRPSQPRSWIGRHPVLFGALVGFGGGCVLGASRVGGSEDHFFNALDEFACPGVGGIGAGIGAAVGWAVSR